MAFVLTCKGDRGVTISPMVMEMLQGYDAEAAGPGEPCGWLGEAGPKSAHMNQNT